MPDLPDASPYRTARYEGGRAAPSGYEPTNLADVLDRILDKGLVIAGDISISLAQVELITIKIRLLLASADKAKEMGIDWWTRDPSLSGAAAGAIGQGEDRDGGGDAEEENRALRQRVAELEQSLAGLLSDRESVASRSEPISAPDLIAMRQRQAAAPVAREARGAAADGPDAEQGEGAADAASAGDDGPPQDG